MILDGQVVEYAGGPNAMFFERRNVRIPAHIRASVERRNEELRNRRVPASVPVVPELTAAEQDELRARTDAILSL